MMTFGAYCEPTYERRARLLGFCRLPRIFPGGERTRRVVPRHIGARRDRGRVHHHVDADYCRMPLAQELPASPERSSRYREEIFRRSFLRVRNVTRRTAELAQDLVWDHQIRPKDAIHVATGLEARAVILETFDDLLIGKSGSIGEPPLIIRAPIGPEQSRLPL